jgi:hypothetical protein
VLQPRYHGSKPPVRDPTECPQHHEGAYRGSDTPNPRRYSPIHPRIGSSQNTRRDILCRCLPFFPSTPLTSLTNRIHPQIIPQPSSQFSGEHWPRLLKAKGKVPHVKTDFDKWVDEDEEEENDRDAAFDLAKLQELSTYEHSTYDDKFYDDEDDMSDADDDMPDLERI